MRLTSALCLLLLATTSSLGQEKTTIKPLVIENPSESVELKYQFSIKGSFSSAGLYVKDVLPNSPLLKMKSLGKTYALEEGDLIIAIKDGQGRFYLPSSKATSDYILNSLPQPRTEIIVRDVRSGFNYRYQVELLAGSGSGGGSGGGSSSPGIKDDRNDQGTIIVLLLGDTNDKSVGKQVRSTLNSVRAVFFKEPTQKKHVCRVIEITGSAFNKKTILNKINEIAVRENDTLVCFINGHGAYDPSLNDYAGGHYFQMPGNLNFPRKELRDALKGKAARFTCLVSETCNVYAPFYLRYPVDYVVAMSNKRFESLFVEVVGFVDLNSSAKNEYSFTGVFGSVFPDSLSVQSKSSGREITWKDYTAELRSSTNKRYKEAREDTLANPKVSSQLKDLLRNQEAQTVHAYELSVSAR